MIMRRNCAERFRCGSSVHTPDSGREWALDDAASNRSEHGRGRFGDMARFIVGLFVVVVAISVCVRPIWARGPGGDPVGVATGQVLLVDRTQGRLELTDGTLLWASDVRQLDWLTNGMRLRVRFEQRRSHKQILSIAPADQ